MKTNIYLAGGFKGGWHDYVIKKLGAHYNFFNPSKHNLDETDKYSTWDLYHVDKCDILLCYMSEDNPSGYGLALEIGYAKAKNKLIILIDQRSPKDTSFQRYFSICHESANVIFDDLDHAITFLKTF